MSVEEARRFHAEHAHYTEDLAYWRRAAARLGGPVLDLGAAAGRVALPLARDGHEVWALDRSRSMLAELGRRLEDEPPEVAARVHPVEGGLADFSLPERFRLVIVAMNTLQVLTDPADRLACMRRVREHLAPGGELIFDVAVPDAEEIAGSLGEERPGGVHRDRGTGEVLRHSAWYDAWEPETHTLEFTLRIRGEGGAPAETLRRHRVHLFTPEEIAELVAAVGMEQIAVNGDFSGGPLRGSGERQVHRVGAVA